MTTKINKCEGGLMVQVTIPKSVKNNTRKSIKTWKIRCLRPDVSSVELQPHIRSEIEKWAKKKQAYFEQVTGKPSTVLGVTHDEPAQQTNTSFQEQPLPGVPA